MSYEPKYKLNRKDAARWHELLVRHCLECPAKPGGKVSARTRKKYPPLSPAENAEFEALSRKRSLKHESHPKVQASIREGQRRERKIRRLLSKLETLVGKMKEAHEAKL